MMACFKANDFSQSPCAKEIEVFINCNEKHVVSIVQIFQDFQNSVCFCSYFKNNYSIY